MAVTPEDGTIVAGANSFVTVTYVDAYALARNSTVWLPASPLVKREAAVLEAGDYLKNEGRLAYRGTRRSYLQTMPYPRDGASERRGPAIPNNVVPWRLMDAQAALAIVALAAPGTLQAPLERGGAVRREKAGEIETEYFNGAPVETLYQEAMGLLAPLLLDEANPLAVPFQAENPDDAAPFEPGVYNNPSTEF